MYKVQFCFLIEYTTTGLLLEWELRTWVSILWFFSVGCSSGEQPWCAQLFSCVGTVPHCHARGEKWYLKNKIWAPYFLLSIYVDNCVPIFLCFVAWSCIYHQLHNPSYFDPEDEGSMSYDTSVYNHKTAYHNIPEDLNIEDFVQHEGYSLHQFDVSFLYIPTAIRCTSLLYFVVSAVIFWSVWTGSVLFKLKETEFFFR